ncbi:deoxyribose-phosphate aldolase [Synechococcus sp. Nb3U1]|uniref:deoxyribose-phosphate aldolase n=1 Tax=Synechococcus sp. Nb3U1 TaxID=1914529 RepID=UPI001F437C65|nr:deoxyribose-phosphate aldolase [Synechococcus sp. Nb3U1]MCF2971569.1 deoxyribose-phosphate aldolase [Synechococcus sp. Nb3U1]
MLSLEPKDAVDGSINLAEYIDHTLLLPMLTPEQFDQGCEVALRYRFPSLCIPPCYVPLAVERLHGSPVQVSTVVGFPMGTATAEVKLYEAQLAVEQGCQELDVRINLAWLKAGELDRLHAEIAQLVEETGVCVKAILETALLTQEEKKLAGEVCIDAGVAFLMTSTGWMGGATVADVQLLWQLSQGKVAIKASGGIRTVAQAEAMIEAGANRLGTSWGLDLMQELHAKGSARA